MADLLDSQSQFKICHLHNQQPSLFGFGERGATWERKLVEYFFIQMVRKAFEYFENIVVGQYFFERWA